MLFRSVGQLAYNPVKHTLDLITRASGTSVSIPGLWRFDGRDWNQVPGVESLPVDGSPAISYNPEQNTWVSFGGGSPSDESSLRSTQTYLFDGRKWTKLSPPTAPSSRAGSGMIYDPDLKLTLLWGGVANGHQFGDTWGWDGADWHLLAT